jgi:hypothetical protein
MCAPNRCTPAKQVVFVQKTPTPRSAKSVIEHFALRVSFKSHDDFPINTKGSTLWSSLKTSSSGVWNHEFLAQIHKYHENYSTKIREKKCNCTVAKNGDGDERIAME